MTRTAHASVASIAVLAASFGGFVCLGLPDGTLSVAWPSLRDELRRTQTDFGLVLLVHGAAYFLSGLFAARLSNRFQPVTLLTGASLVVALGLALVGSAPHWGVLLSAVACIGCGSGVINTVINTYASRNFSARYVNWLHACYSLGAALGPLVMTAVLASQASWRWGYFLVASAPVAMGLVYTLTSAHWKPFMRHPDNGAIPAARFDTLLIRQAALFFCYSGLELTLGRWGYTVLTEWHRVPPESAGLVASCFFGSIFAGRLLLGAAVERVGATQMVRVASVVAVAGAACFALPDRGVAAIGLVVAGLALAPIFPTLVAQSASRISERAAGARHRHLRSCGDLGKRSRALPGGCRDRRIWTGRHCFRRRRHGNRIGRAA